MVGIAIHFVTAAMIPEPEPQRIKKASGSRGLIGHCERMVDYLSPSFSSGFFSSGFFSSGFFSS
ncbi:MAG: hypothetical protein QF516_08720, partial [Pirellulaceae bacterium]|nr:hypothetical protein [Pirellulaceae bacterium]